MVINICKHLPFINYGYFSITEKKMSVFTYISLRIITFEQ